MRVVQLFGREAEEAQRFDVLNKGHLDANLSSITYYAMYYPAIEILTSIALASLIVSGAHRVEVNTLTVGTVAAFLQLVRRFFQPIQDLSDKFNTLQQAMAAAERVFKLLDTERETRERRAGSGEPGAFSRERRPTRRLRPAAACRGYAGTPPARGHGGVRGRVVRVRSRPYCTRRRPACVAGVGAQGRAV